jgi:hypothetical protein
MLNNLDITSDDPAELRSANRLLADEVIGATRRFDRAHGPPKAHPYLENGLVDVDNNTAGRAVKPVAIGRKNWRSNATPERLHRADTTILLVAPL